MAKKSGSKTAGTDKPKGAKKSGNKTKVAARTSPGADNHGTSDAVRKLLESPLVADLLAVGATAALAAIAQHGFGKGEGRGTTKAIKQAGKAAATAMGQRLSTEFKEIRNVAKAKGGAES